MNQESLPLLVAYRDERLSVEGAQQLLRMRQDQSIERHEGKDLPEANVAALLKKARQLQEN